MPKKIKFHHLKEGEVTLLAAISKIQRRDNFSRGVSRAEIMTENKWKTQNQFYGYYNDLRSISKTHYIIQDKKLYYLAENNLVTKRDTARILCLLRQYLKENEGECPDGRAPYDKFVTWVAGKLNYALSAVQEKLEQAAVKQYLRQAELEQGEFYIQPLERMIYEEKWLSSLCEPAVNGKSENGNGAGRSKVRSAQA